MKTLQTPGLALIASVSAIAYTGPSCLSNAMRSRDTAAHIRIEPENLRVSLTAVDTKLAEAADNTDDGPVQEIVAVLLETRAGIIAQMKSYATMFEDVLSATGEEIGSTGFLRDNNPNPGGIGLDDERQLPLRGAPVAGMGGVDERHHGAVHEADMRG